MSHRTRSNRPAYFDEYRAAFDTPADERRAEAPKHAYTVPDDPQQVDTVRYWGELMEKAAAAWAVPRIITVKAPRTDWRDGTDEGWGE